MYNDRNRLQAGVGRIALRPRAQRVDGRVAHPLDRGDIRGMHLPGREAVQKRCLVYIADSNLVDPTHPRRHRLPQKSSTPSAPSSFLVD
jgi:hypothetical protein